MPGTRVGVLSELVSWSVDPDAPRVFWLSGMAGTGKSAIAWSVCEFLESTGHLGGSFFCLRGDGNRNDIKRILPTLACALACRDAAYERFLLN